MLAAMPARAEDDRPKPSPRTVMTIGGASVVLVAANGRLHAFVDGLEDNAPLAAAELAIEMPDGRDLALKRVADGQFVAPFDHAGHLKDAFRVSLSSPVGDGATQAEIAYDDIPPADAASGRIGLRGDIAIALVAGGIGAALATSLMLLALSRRRRAVASGTVGPAQVGPAQVA
jgi:hypothetical protein